LREPLNEFTITLQQSMVQTTALQKKLCIDSIMGNGSITSHHIVEENGLTSYIEAESQSHRFLTYI